MNIEQARSICAIADTGSFTKAAELACLSQPALSQQMHNLEESCGCALFDLRGRNKVLNKYGEIVLKHARHILGTLTHLEESLELYKRARSGILTLAGGDSVLRHVLGTSFLDYHEAHPGVQLRIRNRTSAEALLMVENQQADLAFCTLPLSTQQATIHPWKAYRWVDVWMEDAPDAEKTLIVLEKGTRMRTLLDLQDPGTSKGAWQILEAASVDQQLDFALAGLGTAIVPDYVVKTTNLHCRIREDLGEARLGIVRTYPSSNPAADHFLELLLHKSDF